MPKVFFRGSSPGKNILWWSPDPRSVLIPDRIHISRSLKKFLRKSAWQISCDTRFAEVVDRCANVLRQQEVTPSMAHGLRLKCAKRTCITPAGCRPLR